MALECLNRSQVAELLGVSAKTVSTLVQRGELEVDARPGKGKAWEFSVAAVVAYARKAGRDEGANAARLEAEAQAIGTSSSPDDDDPDAEEARRRLDPNRRLAHAKAERAELELAEYSGGLVTWAEAARRIRPHLLDTRARLEKMAVPLARAVYGRDRREARGIILDHVRAALIPLHQIPGAIAVDSDPPSEPGRR